MPRSRLMVGINSYLTRFEIWVVVVQVGAVIAYVTAVEALRKKERLLQNRMKLSLAQKVVHFWVWSPHPLNASVLFCRFFFNLTRFWTKLRVLVLTIRKTVVSMYPTRPKAMADIEKPTCYVTLLMRTGERPTLHPLVFM